MCIVCHMKISIKNIICDVKKLNGKMYISDADVNRILYPKTKMISRGKRMSKEKLVNLDRNEMIKINGIMFFPISAEHFDDCYGNMNVI